MTSENVVNLGLFLVLIVLTHFLVRSLNRRARQAWRNGQWIEDALRECQNHLPGDCWFCSGDGVAPREP